MAAGTIVHVIMSQLSYDNSIINYSPILFKYLVPNIYHYSHRIETGYTSSQKQYKCTHHNVIK